MVRRVTAPDPVRDPAPTPDLGLLARDLRDAIRPLWRELNARREMSLVRLGALAQLARGGRATAAQLAHQQHVTPQAMTTVIREFEQAGLVVRIPDAQDRRRVWNEITAAGRAVLAADLATGNSWLEQALGERLDADEQAQIAAVLPLLDKLVGKPSDD